MKLTSITLLLQMHSNHCINGNIVVHVRVMAEIKRKAGLALCMDAESSGSAVQNMKLCTMTALADH